MEEKVMLYPMFALIGWSLIIAVVMIARALRAVAEGLNPEYFRYSRGFEVPDYMLAAYQHYSNLFEMPTLFYVASIVIFITGIGDMMLLVTAWAYVAARLLHSLFHLSNRNVPRRRDSFLLSTLLLMAMWGMVIWRVVGQAA